MQSLTCWSHDQRFRACFFQSCLLFLFPCRSVCAGERGARGRGEKGMRRKRERRHPGFDSAAQVFCKAAGHGPSAVHASGRWPHWMWRAEEAHRWHAHVLIGYWSTAFVFFFFCFCKQSGRRAVDGWRRKKKERMSLAISRWRWTPLALNVTGHDGMLLSVNVCIFE
jgi:hypothetical protein